MDIEQLETTMKEAERFLSKAHDLKRNASTFKSTTYYKCKYTASVVRSSLDLTRSLADLRRRNG